MTQKNRWMSFALALAIAAGLVPDLPGKALAESDPIRLYFIPDGLKDRVPMPEGGRDSYQIEAQAGATFKARLDTDD